MVRPSLWPRSIYSDGLTIVEGLDRSQGLHITLEEVGQLGKHTATVRGMAKVDIANAAGCLRYYGGWADKITGQTIDTNSEHSVTGGDSGTNLPGPHKNGEVPGDDLTTDTDGLLVCTPLSLLSRLASHPVLLTLSLASVVLLVPLSLATLEDDVGGLATQLESDLLQVGLGGGL
jgi:hypothetical protein